MQTGPDPHKFVWVRPGDGTLSNGSSPAPNCRVLPLGSGGAPQPMSLAAVKAIRNFAENNWRRAKNQIHWLAGQWAGFQTRQTAPQTARLETPCRYCQTRAYSPPGAFHAVSRATHGAWPKPKGPWASPQTRHKPERPKAMPETPRPRAKEQNSPANTSNCGEILRKNADSSQPCRLPAKPRAFPGQHASRSAPARIMPGRPKIRCLAPRRRSGRKSRLFRVVTPRKVRKPAGGQASSPHPE